MSTPSPDPVRPRPVSEPGVSLQPGPTTPADAFAPAPAPAPAPTIAPHDLRPEHFPTTLRGDGRLGWALGLLAVVGFPGLAIVSASLGMLIAGLLQRGKNPVARHTGTRAAIFGGISLLATIVFFVLIGVGSALEESGSPLATSPLTIVPMVALGIWVVVVGPLTCIVLGIIGAVRPVSREKAERVYAAAAD